MAAASSTPKAERFAGEMRSAGHPVSEWSNGPGDTYAPHNHELSPGDRMDLEPGVVHGATVGPAGVRCVEAHVS